MSSSMDHEKPDITEESTALTKQLEAVKLGRDTEFDIRTKLEPEEPEAPDGGWGWVVCFACFLTHAVSDGIIYSFGLIFVELLEWSQEGKGNTAWISSLQSGLCYLSGPIVAALYQRYGCRPVAAAGSILVCVSYILSVFAPNIYFLYFTVGIMSGFGMGMVFLPTIVCVSIYFDKLRALATGLGVCGTGVGTFAFGPITSYLISEYTWKGTLLILGGIMLNCVTCAMVFRPLETTSRTNRSRKHKTCASEIDKMLDECTEEKDKLSLEVKDMNINCLECKSQEDTKVVLDASNDTEGHNENHYAMNDNVDTEIKPDKKVLSFSRTSLYQVSERREGEKATSVFSEALQNIKESLNLNTLRNTPFLIFVISTAFYSIGYYVPYIYLPDTAKEIGLDESKGAWLISTIGITNTVGRIVFGALSNRKCVNRLFLYSTALVVCGIVTMFVPLYRVFETLLLYSAVFGFSTGVTVSLTTVIIADMVGIKQLAGAYGLTNFFAGIAIFIGPPFVGWLFDISGSYLLTYLVSGLVIIISGVILYFIPCFNKHNTSENPKQI